MEDGEEIDFWCGPIIDEEFFAVAPVFFGDVLSQFHQIVTGGFVGFGVSRIGNGLEVHIGTSGWDIGLFGYDL